MIHFIHKDIKEKESCIDNLLEMTLIYSKKQAHMYIYINDNNPKYFKDWEEEELLPPQLIPFHFSTKHFV